jgi:two-component system LytT family response regulator
MIRCIVIDDEPYARDLLKEFILKVPHFQLVGIFSSALQALPVLSKTPVDVLFLDIQMPDLSGIDFLKSLDKRPSVIFTTAYAEYAIEGFELDVVDYLLKPFDFQRFLKAANKITQKIEKPAEPEITTPHRDDTFMFVKDGTKLVKVELKNILFIKGTREYVTIYTADKKIMSLQSMKNLETELPVDFIRVHNSYIVNIRAIESITKTDVKIGEEIIPIGVTYKKNFQEHINKYLPGASKVI